MFDFCKDFVQKCLTFLLEVCWWKVTLYQVKRQSNYKTTLANEKESFFLYSLFVSGLNNWSQSLASLLVGAPFADKIGQNNVIPSFNASWILASAYRTPGLEPEGYKSVFSVSET